MKNLGASIVFFGNGPVAAASLQGFIDSFGQAAIEAVVTKARAPHHKDPAPVEELCSLLGIEPWFANTKSELDELIAAKAPVSPMGIIIDYGVIVSSQTINYFEKGIINSHFSLLPEWRGADPITYSLLSGQSKTGVSIMLIDEGLDTGPLLAHADYNLDGTETSEELTSDLVELSISALENILPLYCNNETVPVNQQNSPVTYSRKLTKHDGVLAFSKTAAELEREVRAFRSWPKSRTTIAGIDCVITKSAASTNSLQLGEVQVSPEKTLYIGCRVGSIEILELQPAGKNKMPTAAFLNGYGHLL